MIPSTKDSTYMNAEQISKIMSITSMRGCSRGPLIVGESIIRWIDRSSNLRYAVVPTEALAKCVGRTKGAA